jgi:hypothetical protein
MAELQREIWIRGYQNAKQLCLPVYYVYMCFDLTPILPVRNEYFRTHL